MFTLDCANNRFRDSWSRQLEAAFCLENLGIDLIDNRYFSNIIILNVCNWTDWSQKFNMYNVNQWKRSGFHTAFICCPAVLFLRQLGGMQAAHNRSDVKLCRFQKFRNCELRFLLAILEGIGSSGIDSLDGIYSICGIYSKCGIYSTDRIYSMQGIVSHKVLCTNWARP